MRDLNDLVYFITDGNALITATMIVKLVLIMAGMELFTCVCGLIANMRK